MGSLSGIKIKISRNKNYEHDQDKNKQILTAVIKLTNSDSPSRHLSKRHLFIVLINSPWFQSIHLGEYDGNNYQVRPG